MKAAPSVHLISITDSSWENIKGKSYEVRSGINGVLKNLIVRNFRGEKPSNIPATSRGNYDRDRVRQNGSGLEQVCNP